MRIDSPVMTNAQVTGSFSGSFVGSFDGDIQADSVAYANVTGKPTLVSSSAQIDHDSTTNFSADEHFTQGNITTVGTVTSGDVSAILPSGVVSGSVQVNADSITNFDTNVKAKMNTDAVVSGSATNVRSFLNVEDGADVTDTANVTAAGALMDSEIDANLKTFALPASTTISSFGASLVDDANAAAARTTLGVDASGTDNSTDVTLAGSYDYITISGQEITRNQITNDDLAGSIANAKLSNSSVSYGGVSVSLGGSDATPAFDLSDATDYPSANITHDSTTGFVANEHIDHSGVSITAGNGLTGGGTIAATRTINVASANNGIVANANDIELDTASSTFTAGVKAAINTEGAISASVISSPSQGTVRLRTNGVAADADTGLQTGDSPTFSGLTISNDVTINGDLSVLGDATQLQVSALNIEDKNITIASGAADSSAADGAGITIDGANESLTWDHGNSRFTFSDDLNVGGNITVTGTVDGRDIATDGTKLDGIEASATADQTAAEIRTLVESATDSNVFTDADHTKLNGIEASADVTDTDNVTAAGALMDSEVTNLAQVKAFDSSDYATAAQGTTADAALARSGGQMTGNITFSGAQTVDGRDLSADGTKLDGIESGATADQTQADINGLAITEVGTIDTGVWNGTAIASAYLDSDTAHLSGTQTFSGAKSFTLAVNVNATTQSTSKTTGALIVDGGAGIAKTLNVGEDVVAYASSDERLKDNVLLLDDALGRLEQIKGVSFTWNDKQEIYQGEDIGVIAQDVEKVYPEIVETRENGFKAVKYEKLTAVLIEAVKELSARVKELENK